MIVVETVTELRTHVARLRARGRIAFVPTMGNLHAGHVHLMRVARDCAAAVVASIYVNPMQFGQNEDFDSYPRTPEADRAALEAAGVELLFMPRDAEIYPRGLAAQTFVEVPGLGDILCGAFRPGHFRGVATVVNRLFNLVGPDVAVFGKKDYQQLMLIRLMVADLGMPIEIAGIDTVREADSLAMSSRNRYLSASERKTAPLLYKTLISMRDRMAAAGASPAEVESWALDELAAGGFRLDYVSIRRSSDLASPGPGDRALVALAAAWLGRTRLIDNIGFSLA